MFDVVTFGTATRDAFLFSKEKLDIEKDEHAKTGRAIALPLEAKMDLRDIIFTSGGGATNSAVTFARQGLNTACVCRVGSDEGARSIIQELKNENVETDFIQQDENLPTAYSIILDAGSQGRTILTYRGASEKFEIGALSFGELKASWFYIAPLTGAFLEGFAQILEAAKKNGVKVAVNPSAAFLNLGVAKLASWLQEVDIFILNREEAASLTGLPYKKEKEIFKKMDELVKGLVVVTDGPNGVKVSDGKTMWSAGILKEKEVVDRTGAGDAFGSGFVSSLARGKDIAEAIRAGSANATSKVEHIGAKKGLLALKDLDDKRWQVLKIEVMKI